MKRLKKVLLINWFYFSRQVIDLGDVNFLTGKTGAGKSTIIDALQIVLLGETNARNFNKAANDKSDRTLDSYLRTDLDAKHERSRRGRDFTSYIACQFDDDVKSDSFVAGIIFDVSADGSRQDKYFIYTGKIPEHCFMIDRKPMDISKLRLFIRDTADIAGKLYGTQEQYRTDLLAKWGSIPPRTFRLLKRAVSFQPIVDIEKFITEHICDTRDRPDTTAMQQTIRDYQAQEELAKLQESKLSKLTLIDRRYKEMQTLIDRYRIQSFMTLWAEKEAICSNIHRMEQEADACQTRILGMVERQDEIEQERKNTGSQRSKLENDKHTSDVFQERDRLADQEDRLKAEQERLVKTLEDGANELRQEALFLRSACEEIQNWPDREGLLALGTAAGKLSQSVRPFIDCDTDIFSGLGVGLERIHQAEDRFFTALRDTAAAMDKTLLELNEEKKKKEDALEGLRRDRKDYPHRLLSLRRELQERLSEQSGKPIAIKILADTLELADGQENWRGAAEGYLRSQKFHLLVPVEYFEQASVLYDGMKRRYVEDPFGLVDIGKLREQERLIPMENSLAGKIETDDPLARSYIDYLLGRVVCCEDVRGLRNYKIAITPGGMLYQGYVLRPIPRHVMEDAFIGRKAVEIRIRRLEAQLEEIREEIEIWEPVEGQLKRYIRHEALFTDRYLQNDLRRLQSASGRVRAIHEELTELEDRMSHLDLSWLYDMDRQIQELTERITALGKEKENLVKAQGAEEEKLRNLREKEIPKLDQKRREREKRIDDTYDPQFQKTQGIPQYLAQLSRLDRPEKVLKNYEDQVERTKNELEQIRNSLFTARKEYIAAFPPCAFQSEAADNLEFEEEMRRLQESELPRYKEKIREARESAMEQFQNDFLAKLSGSIQQVRKQVDDLNRVLRNEQFGSDRYHFIVERSEEYKEYYDMIQDFRDCDGGLFTIPLQKKYGPLIEDLFSQIAAGDSHSLNARKKSELDQNIERFTDFRTYLHFDLKTTDQNGKEQLLSKTLNTRSGGETQTPFYIAVLASFAQIYQVHDPSIIANNTMRLVMFDEAFNKMDSDRIIESIRLLRKLGLQAIICTPPEKIGDIAPLADKTLLVGKKAYRMYVLPWSKEGAWNEQRSSDP